MTAGAIAVPTVLPLRAPIPGQHKTCIDTNTKVEVKSDNPNISDVTIYYTLNGNKPEPFLTHGPAAKSTYKYREPFRLPGGRRTVKAVAVSRDGMRESNIVTKTFDVEQLETDPPRIGDDGLDFVNDMPRNDLAKKEVRKFAHKMVSSKEAWAEMQKMKETEEMMKEMSLIGTNKGQSVGPKYLNYRLGNTSERVTIGSDKTLGIANGLSVNGYMESDNRWRSKIHPDTATQALRLQRETDFLKCIYCFAPRPSDPYARFCNECGNPAPSLPQTRIPPPEAGQVGTCVQCKSLVPFNTPSCVICEAPIPQQNVPQATIKLAAKLVCVECGTGNPSNMTYCVMCEARLPTHAKPLYHGTSAPPLPKEDGRLVACNKCGRVNNPDARFCDWCGSKPSYPMSSLICSKCQASNHAYSKHCGSCGVLLEPPQRPDVRNSGMAINFNSQNGAAHWMPLSIPVNPVPKCDMASQTVGLFYPSQREIIKKNQEEDEKEALEKQMKDRKPLLTAISPGRGYWRKQMDHICAHLKTYAQNDTEFRALIGEPRMGKIVSSAVHEDGYELSLTVNFALRGTKDPFTGKPMMSEYLSTYTTGQKASSIRSYASQDSLVSGESTSRSTSRRSKRKSARRAKKNVKKVEEEKITPEDKQLLKELGKNGDGRPSEVHQMIEEGADPNCSNKDGVPVLHLAVANKHIEAISILIQEGADINKKGPKGNTALHESVSMGTSAMEVIDTLLEFGANPQKKNNKGETAYDLAVKGGYEGIACKFTSTIGHSALEKLIKPKSSGNSDDF